MVIHINKEVNQAMNRSSARNNNVALMRGLDNLIGSMLLQQPNMLPDMQNPITNQSFMDAQAYQMANQPPIPTPVRQNGGVSGSWESEPVVGQTTFQEMYGNPDNVAQNLIQPTYIRDIPQETQQPQKAQQQQTVQQQVQETAQQPQQGGLTLDALLGSLLGGLTQPITQPLVSDTGDTSTLMDMMRFVANTQSPEVGKIFENNLVETRKQAVLNAKNTKEKSDAQVEYINALIKSGKYTPESIEQYIATGDMKKLKPAEAKHGVTKNADYYFAKTNNSALYTTPTPEQLADPRLQSRIITTADGQKVIQLKQINANDKNITVLNTWNGMMKLNDDVASMLNEFNITPDMIITRSPLLTKILKDKKFITAWKKLSRSFQEYRTAKTGTQASDKEIERLKPLMPTLEERNIDIMLENLLEINKESSDANNRILNTYQGLGYDTNGLSTLLYQPRNISSQTITGGDKFKNKTTDELWKELLNNG